MIRSAASSNHELTTRGGLTQPLGLLTGGAGFVVGVADLDPSGFWHHLACSALKHRKKSARSRAVSPICTAVVIVSWRSFQRIHSLALHPTPIVDANVREGCFV